jgi:hypothetical protein
MKSQTVLATAELDALSKTARGESRMSEYSGENANVNRAGNEERDVAGVRQSADDIEKAEGRGRRLSRRTSEKSQRQAAGMI